MTNSENPEDPADPIVGPVAVGVAGCNGRMGRAILRELAGDTRFRLVAAIVRPENALVGTTVTGLEPALTGDVIIGSDPEALFQAADVVFDFTSPGATTQHAGAAASSGTALLVGTTGLGATGHEALVEAAQSAPVLIAPNTCLAVNLMIAFVRQAAGALGAGYAIEITDLHHAGKADAPSGTALALAAAASEGKGKDEGITISSRREGDAPGEHRVSFIGRDDRLELFHQAGDRALFARGALAAALWLSRQPPGLYAMSDMVG